MATGVLHVRLDAETRRALEEFREESGIPNDSAAVRVLLALGLEKSAAVSSTMKRKFFDEATVAAQRKLKHKLATVLHETMNEYVE